MPAPDRTPVQTTARTIGRPRAKGPSRSGLSTEQDILAAAARLFCRQGYGSTSTHAIAESAGISQASMYHYFAGKHAILRDLLLATVRPSVVVAEELSARTEPADARLWALCVYDVELLLGGDDNTGSLYLMPEIDDVRFADFHLERKRLYGVYRSLVARCAGVDEAAAHARASLVFGLVESVILRRRTEPDIDAAVVAPDIAAGALRILDITGERLEAAQRVARGIAQGSQRKRTVNTNVL